MTIARSDFTPDYLDRLESFYDAVFGWKVNRKLSIDGERTLLDIPGNRQYLNIRAADHPMDVTGYEHMGVYLDSVEAVKRAYVDVKREADPAELELDERGIQVLYDGRLTTFRFRYLIPLAIEIQHIG